ncbi:MAG: antitoxin VbhA family protein [Burkholderiales bacterium]
MKARKLTRQQRQDAVRQSLASSAIEGFEPDAEYLALLDRYISGELTIAQVSAVTDAQFGITHKTARAVRT